MMPAWLQSKILSQKGGRRAGEEGGLEGSSVNKLLTVQAWSMGSIPTPT